MALAHSGLMLDKMVWTFMELGVKQYKIDKNNKGFCQRVKVCIHRSATVGLLGEFVFFMARSRERRLIVRVCVCVKGWVLGMEKTRVGVFLALL